MNTLTPEFLIYFGLALCGAMGLCWLMVKFSHDWSDEECEWHREHYLNLGEDE